MEIMMEISWWKHKWWYSLPTAWHIMASREIPEANGGVHREIIKLNGNFPARYDCRRMEGIASCTLLLKVKTMVSRMGSTLKRDHWQRTYIQQNPWYNQHKEKKERVPRSRRLPQPTQHDRARVRMIAILVKLSIPSAFQSHGGPLPSGELT